MNARWLTAPAMGSLARFAVVFVVLIVPWPGWNAAYGAYFRGFGNWVFGGEGGSRAVEFSRASSQGNDIDTKISISNRAGLDANGNGPVKRTGLDSRSIGWLPTALTAALILATSISWRRRAFALLAGLVLIHLFVAFSLLIWIWDNTPDVASTPVSDWWKTATSELSYALVSQLGISFTVPVLIWVLVTFKRQDALTLT